MRGKIVGVVHENDVFTDVTGEHGERFECGVYCAGGIGGKGDIVEKGVDIAVEQRVDDIAGEYAVGGERDALVEDKAVCRTIFDVGDAEWFARKAADIVGVSRLDDVDIGIVFERQNLGDIIVFVCGFERSAQAVVPDIVADGRSSAYEQAVGEPKWHTPVVGLKKVGKKEFFEAQYMIAMKVRNDGGING